MSEQREAAETQEHHEHRSLFERFVEVAQKQVSRAPFFAVCVGIVVVWFASFPLWPNLKEWQVAIHTVASVISLLLLVLLENAGRRSDEAAQEKLNVLAEALAALMEAQMENDRDLEKATKELRESVGLEERH
jgi:low affinity Fe/Cu permease